MKDLYLALVGTFFDEIKRGEKLEEYRLDTAYWRKRLIGRKYRNIILTRGYPPKADTSKRLVLPYRGYEMQDIIHPHFGDKMVHVFAIDVSGAGRIRPDEA